MKLCTRVRFYFATLNLGMRTKPDSPRRDEDGFHIRSTSSRCSSHSECTSLLRAAHSSPSDRVFVYFSALSFPKMPQLTHHARFPAYYLHTCFTNSIRALPCHPVTCPQQLKIILGAAVIYYTTLTFFFPSFPPVMSRHVFVSLTNLLKSQIIHLILNYSLAWCRAPLLQGFVVTGGRAARLQL